MMKGWLCIVLCTAGLWLIKDVDAHGRLMKPCQRASLHRCYGPGQFKANFDDMGLFCGGTQVKYISLNSCSVWFFSFNNFMQFFFVFEEFFLCY